MCQRPLRTHNAAIRRSIEDRACRASKLPFVVPPFLHWSAEVRQIRSFIADETPECVVDYGSSSSSSALLRRLEPRHGHYRAAVASTNQLIESGKPVHVTAQNVAEFRAAATRAPAQHGLGLSVVAAGSITHCGAERLRA
jgi:hypothetical protein